MAKGVLQKGGVRANSVLLSSASGETLAAPVPIRGRLGQPSELWVRDVREGIGGGGQAPPLVAKAPQRLAALGGDGRGPLGPGPSRPLGSRARQAPRDRLRLGAVRRALRDVAVSV